MAYGRAVRLGALVAGRRPAGRAGDAFVLGKQLANLELHLTIWRGIQSFLAGFLPRSEEESDKLLDKPYVAQYDEDWMETEAEDSPPLDVPASVVEEEDEIVVTAEPDEDLEAYQRELPMGRPAGHGWELPPLDLLAEAAEVEIRPVDNEARSQLIVETLASFGVDARVASINQGPTVTQFGVEPGWETKTRTVAVRDDRGRQVYDRDGRPQTRTETISRTRVRVNRITSLANDLALALAAPTIRIEAPVPGKPIIGIEVPNTTTSLVAIRSVVESTAFQKANLRSRLAIALGKGVSGEPVAADLAKMPHLLIAGATGSGKSVCINSIIACFLLHNTPEELRLVLIDPKRVELANFAQIPHLAFSKIITDTEEVVGTLQAIIHEMDSRYRRFASVGVRNIEGYNKSPARHAPVAVLGRRHRRAGRPHDGRAVRGGETDLPPRAARSRDGHPPHRRDAAAFGRRRHRAHQGELPDAHRLRRILAGRLAHHHRWGRRGEAARPRRHALHADRRLQAQATAGLLRLRPGAGRIVTWWTSDRFRHLVPDKLDHLLEEAQEETGDDRGSADDDPLYEAAKELAGQHSRVSTSMLQRRLHIGYPRAARLIDLLEENGVVSAAEGSQSREVLGGSWEEEEDRFE